MQAAYHGCVAKSGGETFRLADRPPERLEAQAGRGQRPQQASLARWNRRFQVSGKGDSHGKMPTCCIYLCKCQAIASLGSTRSPGLMTGSHAPRIPADMDDPSALSKMVHDVLVQHNQALFDRLENWLLNLDLRLHQVSDQASETNLSCFL